MSSKNARSKIWLYAVVLFTSAFIVLLITAYSQIKLNRNLSDLSNQVYTKEHEKDQVQLSFANAQELNGKLSDENKRLQEEIAGLTSEIEALRSDRDLADKLNTSRLDAYEKLSRAQGEYLKGKKIESAQLVGDVDPNLLNTYAGEAYEVLKSLVYNEAGKQLMDEGYELYLKKDYAGAKGKLEQSWLYAPDKDYSDKCLYYLALSEEKSGNAAAGVGHMKTLVQKFPSSRYLSGARRFLAKYPDMQP